ncbi:hypothetical protein BB560_005536 [Smittium megazygosporum]|uniref:Inositol hexakisphosphate and diphosphoinositol-pentakisphosphate kinase n=1 Tax=Smittium megazygosporum TaxID=133381 RepID=A0A2T9Z3S9_9FUNG|nr:hypothetical protein BB560_005536 [Smittium megazygosporum]
MTHSGILQTLELAENVKKDLNLLNPDLLKDVKMYRGNERRVEATTNVFSNVVCQDMIYHFCSSSETNLACLSPQIGDSEPEYKLDPSLGSIITVDPGLLDDASAIKNETDKAKIHLRNFFNYRGNISENIYYTEGMNLPNEMASNPREFIKSIGFLLEKLVSNMHKNFKHLSESQLEVLQPYWCCYETPKLFKERWEKMLADFKLEVFDDVIFEPSKVGELYDSLKFDALHSRNFLESILCEDQMGYELGKISNKLGSAGTRHEPESVFDIQGSHSPPNTQGENPFSAHSKLHTNNKELYCFGVQRNSDFSLSPVLCKSEDISNFETHFGFSESPSSPSMSSNPRPSLKFPPVKDSISSSFAAYQNKEESNARKWVFESQRQHLYPLIELYHKSKVLFDFVTPREYGINPEQKLKIGILGSKSLYSALIDEFKHVINGSPSRSRFYFTKESHLHTLINLVYASKFPTLIPYNDIGELDYLTHITFEIYEREQNKHLNPNDEFSLRLGFSGGSSTKNLMDIQVGQDHVLGVSNRM